MDRPIPAFYCVYLLRSSVRPSNPRDFYIGSTPDPCRRQKQHNGIATGGAKRTEQHRKRPWRMCLIISGFSSKISALQFEWAWQHTYKTRFVRPEQKTMVTQGVKRTKLDKNGLQRAKTQDPSRRLPALMNDLQVLIASGTFSRLPLSIQFFQPEVYKQWQCSGTALRSQSANDPCAAARDHRVDPEVIGPDDDPGAGKPDGIDGLDVSYASHEQHVLKSMARLSHDERISCSLCSRELDKMNHLSLFCRSESCGMASHMTCLAEYFLKQEKNSSDIMPVHGSCPSCGKSLKWSELVRELSLRLRGHRNVEKLLKVGNGAFKYPRANDTCFGVSRGSFLDDVDELGEQRGLPS